MSGGVVKIAISVDAPLFKHAERLRRRTGESRSALVRRALRRVLDEETLARAVRSYAEAYERVPETAEAIEAARQSALVALAAVPWDDP